MTMHRIITGVAAAALAAAAHADSIRMKGSVRLDRATTAVTVADIAVLDGPEAGALADVVVFTLDDPTRAAEIDVDTVRAALDAAGTHWGRVNLTGRRTVIRPRVGAAAAPIAMAGMSLDRAPTTVAPATPPKTDTVRNAADLVEQATLGGEIARMLVRELDVPAARLRLTFTDDHADVLTVPLAGARFEIVPLGNLHNETADLRIRTWTDGRTDRQWLVRLGIEVQQQMVVAAADLPRRTVLTPEHLRVQPMWVGPRQAQAALTRSAIEGRSTALRIDAGAVIHPTMLHREMVIRRGDPVFVRCIVGGLVVSLQAEARADGAQGDIIPLRKEGERKDFNARVNGPGEATVDLATSRGK